MCVCVCVCACVRGCKDAWMHALAPVWFVRAPVCAKVHVRVCACARVLFMQGRREGHGGIEHIPRFGG